jgi:hypothetical protein
MRRALNTKQAACWTLDHLVYGVQHLERGIDQFHRLTGVEPAIGGQHKGLGTHNAIFSLGDNTYFEIIAPDPSQGVDCAIPKWMGMDKSPLPRMLTWAVRVNIDDRAQEEAAFDSAVIMAGVAGYDAGDVGNFKRDVGDQGTLEWSLAYNHYKWCGMLNVHPWSSLHRPLCVCLGQCLAMVSFLSSSAGRPRSRTPCIPARAHPTAVLSLA